MIERLQVKIRERTQRKASGDPAAKLELIRKSAEASFPTGDIDQMLAEIAHGYTNG